MGCAIGDAGNERVAWRIEWVDSAYEDDWHPYCIDVIDGLATETGETANPGMESNWMMKFHVVRLMQRSCQV